MCSHTVFVRYFLPFKKLHMNPWNFNFSLTGSPVTLKILQNWVPRVSHYFDKEHYTYVGHQIVIQESIEHFGAVVWPGVSTQDNTEKAHMTRANQDSSTQILRKLSYMTLLTIEASLCRMKFFSRKLCLRVICKFMPKELWHQSICTLDVGIEKKFSKGTQ